MISAYYIAAFSLGLLGSFHCIAMCGPIALALPLKGKDLLSKLFSALIYNAGRILTYAALGLLFGLLGQGFSLFGWQQIFSVVVGVIILLALILPQKFLRKIPLSSALSGLFIRLKSKLSWLFSKRNYASILSIGLLNGLLPCGLVYMALAGAAGTGDTLSAVSFMLLFGLGTFPVMLVLNWSRHFISVQFRQSIRKFTPVAVSIMALLMILRGLDLNIPYLSPSFDKKNQAVNCCETTSAKNTCEKNCCHQ